MEIESAIREAMTRLEAQSLDAFEVVGLTERSLTIESKMQMTDRAVHTARSGISIRAIRDGRMGLASTAEMSPKSVIQAVRSALDSAANVAPSEEAVLPKPQGEGGRIEESPGRGLADVPYDEKAAVALAAESAAIAADSRVSKVQQARYGEEIRSLSVVNSLGVAQRFERGICFASAKVVANGGTGAESGHELAFTASFDDLDAGRVGRLAAGRAVAKLGAAPASGGRIAVLFEPRAAAAMLSLLVPSFFADNIQRGKSTLAGMLGKRAYDHAVTVVDEGLMPNGCNSFAFDWEGIPKRRTVMIRDGAIESWLYDGARAAKDGVASTGSCVRGGLDKQPAVGVSNCFLKGGAVSPDALAAQMGKGIVATDLLGLHTANTISGSFSLGLEGFLMEGGVGRSSVRAMTIAGSVHDLFKQVVAVGNDLTFTGPFGAPSVLVEGLMIGS